MKLRSRPRTDLSRLMLLVAAFTASIAVMFAPEWIETVFGVSPDGGSGQLEWLFAVLGVLGVLVTSATAGRWYRASRKLLAETATETVTP